MDTSQWTRRSLLIRIGWCIVAGVLLNIIVAVGCALAAQQWPKPVTRISNAADIQYVEHRHPGQNDVTLQSTSGRMKGFGYRELLIARDPVVVGSGTHRRMRRAVCSEVQAGWPLYSLAASKSIFSDQDMTAVKIRMMARGTPIVLSSVQGQVVFPLTPLWRGIAINSLFYAVVLGCVLLPPVIRRAVRAHRGFCPHCAYPAGTSERCSECGQLLSASARVDKDIRADVMIARLLVRVGFVVLAGVLINLLAAFLCAIVAQNSPGPVARITSEREIAYLKRQYPEQGVQLLVRMLPQQGVRTEGFGYRELLTLTDSHIVGSPPKPQRHIRVTAISDVHAGWPFHSMAASKLSYSNLDSVVMQQHDAMLKSETPIIVKAMAERMQYPTKPIWPGFAINSLFYAALIAVGIVLAILVRRLKA